MGSSGLELTQSPWSQMCKQQSRTSYLRLIHTFMAHDRFLHSNVGWDREHAASQYVARIYGVRRLGFAMGLTFGEFFKNLPWDVRKKSFLFFITVIATLWDKKKKTTVSPWLVRHGSLGVPLSQGPLCPPYLSAFHGGVSLPKPKFCLGLEPHIWFHPHTLYPVASYCCLLLG